MKYTSVIFDLDGTLIDSSDGVVDAVNYSLRMMGDAERPPNEIKPYIGYPLSQMYPHFSGAPIRDLYSHFQKRAAQTVVAATTDLPGVNDVLIRLNDWGYKMGIATTKVRSHVDGIIEKLAWTDLFVAWSGGNEVKRVKPDPDIFELTLDRMKATPARTLVVGDTINDIIAAKRVPMEVAGVYSPYGGNDILRASKPDFLLNSLDDLLELLNPNGRE